MGGLLGYSFSDRWDTGIVVMRAQIKHGLSLGLKGGDSVTGGQCGAQGVLCECMIDRVWTPG